MNCFEGMESAATIVLNRLFLSAFAVLLLSLPASGQAMSVSQSLGNSQIAFEDSVMFQITLQWDGPQSAYLFSQPLQPDFDRMRVGGFSSSISSTGDGPKEVTTKKYSYTLKPTSSGNGRIDAVTIRYIAMPDSIPGELITEPMSVTIAEPIPKMVAEDSNRLWYLVGSLALLLGAGVSVIVYRRTTRVPQEPVKSPTEQLLDSLPVIRQKAGNDFKKFQGSVCDLIQQFLQQQYGLEASALSDDQLQPALSDTGLNESQVQSLSDWLIAARRDKFRPVTAGPGETVRLESELRQFFENI